MATQFIVPPKLPDLPSAPRSFGPITPGYAELFFMAGQLSRRSADDQVYDVVLDRAVTTDETVGSILLKLLELTQQPAGGSMPLLIADGETYVIGANQQQISAVSVTVDGTLVIEGHYVEL